MTITAVSFTQGNQAYNINGDMFSCYPLDYPLILEWIDSGNTPTPYVPPVPTWLDKRLASVADGGYGTLAEQLEMIGEQGMTVYQTHVQTVKTNNPKLV